MSAIVIARFSLSFNGFFPGSGQDSTAIETNFKENEMHFLKCIS